jgi:hypothetical protein
LRPCGYELPSRDAECPRPHVEEAAILLASHAHTYSSIGQALRKIEARVAAIVVAPLDDPHNPSVFQLLDNAAMLRAELFAVASAIASAATMVETLPTVDITEVH